MHIHPFTHACARGHQGARASLCLSVDGPYDPLCQQRVFRGHVARNSMREYILAMMRQLEEDEVFGKDAEAFELFLDDDLGMLVCTVQCARAYRPTHAHIYLIPYLYLPIAPCFYLPISRYSWLLLLCWCVTSSLLPPNLFALIPAVTVPASKGAALAPASFLTFHFLLLLSLLLFLSLFSSSFLRARLPWFPCTICSESCFVGRYLLLDGA